MYDIKFLQTSSWNNLHPHQVIGTAALVKEIDCLTATVDDILKVRSNISSSITLENTRFCGFGGWFDVHFRVSWSLVSVFVMHPRTPNHLQVNIILCFLSFWWCTREGGRTQLRKRLSWQLPQALIMGHIGANRYEQPIAKKNGLLPLIFNSFLNIWKKKKNYLMKLFLLGKFWIFFWVSKQSPSGPFFARSTVIWSTLLLVFR